MKTEKKRERFDRQFNLDAVNLVINGGRSVAEVARDRGIEVNIQYRWKRNLEPEGAHAFPGKGGLSPQEEALRACSPR